MMDQAWKDAEAKGAKRMGKKKIGPVKKGALHEELGISQDKPISSGKLEAAKAKAKKTGNATLMKRANFALNARHWKH